MTPQAPPTPRAQRIAHALTAAFTPVVLKVEDESARHAGHAGAAPGGETHFAVTVVSESFVGLSRVDRSRILHATLQGEFDSGLHALSLKLSSPDEWPSKKS